MLIHFCSILFAAVALLRPNCTLLAFERPTPTVDLVLAFVRIAVTLRKAGNNHKTRERDTKPIIIGGIYGKYIFEMTKLYMYLASGKGA